MACSLHFDFRFLLHYLHFLLLVVLSEKHSFRTSTSIEHIKANAIDAVDELDEYVKLILNANVTPRRSSRVASERSNDATTIRYEARKYDELILLGFTLNTVNGLLGYPNVSIIL